MISVKEASEKVLNNLLSFADVSVSLENSYGRVLKEDIRADRDFPPYNRVAMDGIAIDFEYFSRGQKSYKIEKLVAAGDPQTEVKSESSCVEIMTGAIMPLNLNTVIPYEEIEITNGMAVLKTDSVHEGQNIHRKGTDSKKGDIVIPKGRRINSPEIGVLATVGKSEVKVEGIPKAIIISTGNELVEIDEDPAPHQIRKSNVERMRTSLLGYDINAQTDHILDDLDSLESKLKSYLTQFEVIILSGGVSKGKLDFVPEALEKLGVTKHFHRVKQRPGKPFWFGTYKNKTAVFAMPGNPVSSFLCTHRYLIPWLERSMGINSETVYAQLSEDLQFEKNLTFFADVKLRYNPAGILEAVPVKAGGSGDLAKLVISDAFIELPEDKIHFKKGEVFQVWRYRY